MICRADKRLCILANYSKKFNRITLTQLYKSYIRPIIEYSDIVWCNCNMGEMNDIEEVNRRAMRIICGAKKGTSHEYLYRETGLERMCDRRKNHVIIMFRHILNTTRRGQLNKSYVENVRNRNPYGVRNADLFNIIKM